MANEQTQLTYSECAMVWNPIGALTVSMWAYCAFRSMEAELHQQTMARHSS